MEVSFQQGIGDANRLELDLGSNFGTNDGHDYTHSILSVFTNGLEHRRRS